MSGTVHTIPPEVLTVLALPALDGLDELRTTGRVCVWGGERLWIDSAIDLGEQQSSDVTWFPRACRKCVAERAHRGLIAHEPLCQLCRSKETSNSCAVGQGLYRVYRDCWL